MQVDYKINHNLCKQATRGKTTLIGTVDPSSVMTLGTSERVMEKARHDIDHLAPHGGFILSPGCTLPHTAPDDNVTALVEAARVYGRYDA
ncbi:MAG: hypothetical protein HC875_36640 [Anaerolineales bacterium]|nr:hypothetical protein [Anaerolineales bacterium]